MAGIYLSSVVSIITLCYSLATEDEPTCSKLMYDKQMLETIVRMEAKLNQWERERKAFEESVLSILEHRREEMEQKFKKQNENLDRIFVDYNDIREKLKNKTSLLKEKVGTKPNIAFNAYTNSGGNYGVGQILLFPNVLLNEGGGYDKNTGVFTAPEAGLYYFSVHICNYPGAYMVAAIVHGSTEVAITTEYENNKDSCSSVQAPLIMKKGERVHVKSTYAGSKLIADATYRWPSFAGVLLNI